MSLVVVGSVAIDHLITPVGEMADAMGGSASYFSCAASTLAPVNLVGIVGHDYPDEHIELLRTKNVDLRGLHKDDSRPSFRWRGRYSDDFMEAETLDLALNVFEDFEPRLPEDYRSAKYVFLANIDPELQRHVIKQVSKPDLIVMDTMNFWIETKLDELKKTMQEVDILILNDAEARMLSGEKSLYKAARVLLEMGPGKVIVKRGEHGAFMLGSCGEHFSIPAYPVEKVVDTTGAGDSFAGGFMGYLAKDRRLTEQSFRHAMVYGACMSSFTVEDFSLRKLCRITLKDVEQRFNVIRQMTAF